MNRRLIIVSALFAFDPSAHAQVHQGDVILHTPDGAIVTGVGVPSLGTYEERRIFTTVLGVVFPNFTDNPGFDCEQGTFPVPSSNGFNVLDALWRWDGATFGLTGGEVMRISLGPVNVTTGTGFVAGFTLSVSSTGAFHRHYSFLLQQGTAPAIGDGVYLLQLELYNTDPSIDPSKPFYVLFNRNASASDMDDAAAWVQANLIDEAEPCPGDANGDGVVDFTDFSIVLSQYGMTGPDLQGDLNNDGVVDFTDFSTVLSNYGVDCNAAAG